jgi:hypothetical protein
MGPFQVPQSHARSLMPAFYPRKTTSMTVCYQTPNAETRFD